MRWIAAFLIFLIVGAVAYHFRGQLPELRQWAQSQVDEDSASAIAIDEFTLSNGLEVILLANDRVPAVSHTLWLRVGASDDPAGKSGLAHYHEHLMFKGTPDVPKGEFTKRLEALGGEFNAFTGHDFTGYYVNIAREHLELVMQMESDRLQHLMPDDTDYPAELDVIVEERQSRIGNRPPAQWAEQLQAALFLHHPYRVPIIGWMHEIKGLSAEDAKAFYKRYYHAGNMVLVVAGDVTRAELEPLAEKYYGRLPTREAALRDWAAEPPAVAARTVTMYHESVQKPRFQRRYLAPSYGYGNKEQVMPLALLAQWMGEGKASLLYAQLVEKQRLAVAVNVSYSGFSRGPSQFTIYASPAPGVSMARLEKAIDAVLERVKREAIADDDLQRMKTLFKASAIYARDGLSGMAQYAGYLAMLGLPLETINDWEKLVEAVAPEMMQRAAQEVLVPERSVTGYLLPKKATVEAPDA